MRKIALIITGVIMLAAVAVTATSCFSNYPTDEDGLLISHRTRTSILNMNMNDPNNQTVLVSVTNNELETRLNNPFIDTLDYCVVRVLVKWKTDIKKIWPIFSLADDCKLEPKVTSLTDFTEPREYTVISGDRKHRKKYKVYVIRQDPDDPQNPNPNTADNPWYDYFEEIYSSLPH